MKKLSLAKLIGIIIAGIGIAIIWQFAPLLQPQLTTSEKIAAQCHFIPDKFSAC
jgi:hypothetical protein